MSHTKIFCAIIFFLFVNNAFNQSLYNGIGHIPTSNQVQWSNAGLLPNTPTYANNIFNVCNYKAVTNRFVTD